MQLTVCFQADTFTKSKMQLGFLKGEAYVEVKV
jgi:hypothetical protein